MARWRKVFLSVSAVTVVAVIGLLYYVTRMRIDAFEPTGSERSSVFAELRNSQKNRKYGGLPSLKNTSWPAKKLRGKKQPSKKTVAVTLPWAPAKGWMAPRLSEWSADLLSTHVVTDVDYLVTYFRRHGVDAQAGYGGRLEKATTAIEKWYLASPPLTDITLLPDEQNSRIVLLGPSRKYQVGDTVAIRVELFDKWNRARSMGGDHVRIWLTSLEPRTSVAAEVEDLGDGSYVGRTVLKWAGLTAVKVSLTYPREFLRYLVWVRHSVNTLRWIAAYFGNSDNKTSGVTVCLPSSPVPGFPSTCDLTEQNGGFPWFCGRPRNAPWNCDQWRATGNLQGPVEPPASVPVYYMIRKMNSESTLRLVEHSLVFITESGSPMASLPPCWSRAKTDTWVSPAPTGWFQNGSWLAQTCALPHTSVLSPLVHECLRNTTMLMLGDSNMRLWFEAMQGMLGCPENKHLEVFHEPRTCRVPRMNGTLTYAPHAMPFNTGTKSGVQTLPLTTALQAIPDDGSHIVVVVHYFVHLAFYPLDVFRDSVRVARWALELFLRQHPSATVLVRGPHVMYQAQKHPTHPGDASVPWYVSILREEFRDLYHRIWFLNFQDMTIASENLTSHPPEETVMEMLKVFLGYACGHAFSEVHLRQNGSPER